MSVWGRSLKLTKVSVKPTSLKVTKLSVFGTHFKNEREKKKGK